MAQVRARSTAVTNPDGTVSHHINIGVEADHPLADRERRAGNSDLYNIRLGPFAVPAAPQFVVNYRRD